MWFLIWIMFLRFILAWYSSCSFFTGHVYVYSHIHTYKYVLYNCVCELTTIYIFPFGWTVFTSFYYDKQCCIDICFYVLFCIHMESSQELCCTTFDPWIRDVSTTTDLINTESHPTSNVLNLNLNFYKVFR